jgi:dolichol-phosphate mannosyltransferase
MCPSARSAVWVVLPAYNERAGLERLLDGFRRVGDQGRSLRLVVVDDGSTDGTAEVANAWSGQLCVTVVQHARNEGLAAALHTGLRSVLEHAGDQDVVVTMDADDTHPPELMRPLTATLDEHCDVAIASRYQPGAREHGVPWQRRVLSRWANRALRCAKRVPGVTDYTSGLRAYRAGALRRGFAEFGDRLVAGDGFACTAALLLQLARIGCTFREIPIDLRYDRKLGASKLPFGRTAWGLLKLLLMSPH